MGRARAKTGSARSARIARGAALAGGGVIIVLALALAITPLLNNAPAPPASPAAQSVVISMAGFSPNRLTVPAGQPLTLTVANPDSQFHTDGGGWHQFAIDALEIDVRVAPHSRQIVTLGPLAPGKYVFYCDICCGGKTNPSMIGILEVKG